MQCAFIVFQAPEMAGRFVVPAVCPVFTSIFYFSGLLAPSLGVNGFRLSGFVRSSASLIGCDVFSLLQKIETREISLSGTFLHNFRTVSGIFMDRCRVCNDALIAPFSSGHDILRIHLIFWINPVFLRK